MVDRFNIYGTWGDNKYGWDDTVRKEPDGVFVKYAEYEKLEKRIRELEGSQNGTAQVSPDTPLFVEPRV